jgi:hypothetical protein
MARAALTLVIITTCQRREENNAGRKSEPAVHNPTNRRDHLAGGETNGVTAPLIPSIRAGVPAAIFWPTLGRRTPMVSGAPISFCLWARARAGGVREIDSSLIGEARGSPRGDRGGALGALWGRFFQARGRVRSGPAGSCAEGGCLHFFFLTPRLCPMLGVC